MSTEVTTTEPTDADLLRQLWRLQLKTLIAELSSGEAKASCLAVARAFLAEEGVTLKTLNTVEGKGQTISALASLENLPSFDEEPRRDDALAKRYAD